MLDVYLADTNLTILVLALSLLFLLPMQLMLCFRAKSMILRLLPIIMLAIATLVFILMTLPATGWAGLAYVLFAIYAAFALLICGLGWAIWAILKRKRR